jgi:hypothetical protein
MWRSHFLREALVFSLTHWMNLAPSTSQKTNHTEKDWVKQLLKQIQAKWNTSKTKHGNEKGANLVGMPPAVPESALKLLGADDIRLHLMTRLKLLAADYAQMGYTGGASLHPTGLVSNRELHATNWADSIARNHRAPGKLECGVIPEDELLCTQLQLQEEFQSQLSAVVGAYRQSCQIRHANYYG